MKPEEVLAWAAEGMADPVGAGAAVNVRPSRRPTDIPEVFLWIEVDGAMVQNECTSLSAWQDALRLALDSVVSAV